MPGPRPAALTPKPPIPGRVAPSRACLCRPLMGPATYGAAGWSSAGTWDEITDACQRDSRQPCAVNFQMIVAMHWKRAA